MTATPRSLEAVELEERPTSDGQVSRLASAVAAFRSDSLARNSFWLISNSALLAVLGFVFWTVAARRYTEEHVGLVTAISGGVGLASSAASLGLPNTIIRFLVGERDRRAMVACAVLATASLGGVLGAAWVMVPGQFGTPFSEVGGRTELVVVLALAVGGLASSAIVDAAFTAMRSTALLPVKSVAGSLARVLLLLVLPATSSLRLLAVFVLGIALSTVVGLVVLTLRYPGRIGPDAIGRGRAAVGRASSFVAGNYVATLVAIIPLTTLPMITVARLGSADAAYFAIPLMICNLLTFIPQMTSQSLLAEAAHSETDLPALITRSLRGIYAVMVPAALVMAAVAPLVLSVFGPDYSSNGTTVLRLLALGALVSSFSYVADTVLNARRQVRAYVVVNTLGTVVVLGAAVAGMSFGLAGLGWGWIAGQLGYAVIAAVAVRGGGRR
ncbi:MAG: lipopolysaccharide biosynthesis protein [Acidimicrobiales bacterium]|nr:lipopolysaccharide biosynthesis protein [Acidimicrobiales bacterium]